VLLPLLAPALAQSPPSEARARHAFDLARTRFEKASSDVEAAWQLGRAAFDLAERAEDNDERKTLADQGADACRAAIAQAPKAAAAHYYLALNLGQLARARKWSALKTLHEMEQELLAAGQIDPKLDYGGPDRALGVLYLEAPPHPLSIGNKNTARSRLEAAVRLCPNYPGNRISLAEAYARWGEVKNLERELSALEKLLPDARTQFDPVTWQADWREWEQRLDKVRKTRDRLVANPRLSPSERGAKSLK
jgi:hypothetical protein